MGIKLYSRSQTTKEYKNGVHKFCELSLYRMARPWLYQDFFYRLSPVSFRISKVTKKLHDFSKSVIEERKKNFYHNANNVVYKKRMAMLDTLLAAQLGGYNIDDEGIREEVDTFMFEVCSKLN